MTVPQKQKKTYFDNPTCIECIKKHLEKYENFVDDSGRDLKQFRVPCQGIPQDYVSDLAKASFTTSEQQEVLGILDPVTWAKANIIMPDGLHFEPRWYQEMVMRCSASRRVMRMGRRVGKTTVLAVMILWILFTQKNKKILVVCPYKIHSQEIITRIREFISMNPVLAASVERDVSSPVFEIKFKNGSFVRGFAAGTKSGGGGVGVRGQDADYILLDEADFLVEGDLTAIMAILATHSHVHLWASSTPTGRRAHFWRWCTKSPIYKEFHFPSSVLPHWAEIEENVKADYIGNPEGYVREYKAEFGEETVALFQHQYLDVAIKDYLYSEQTRNPQWTYSFGVDWNTDHGTEIVVVGMSPSNNLFKVVEAVNIPRQGWTQLAGLEMIIKMNVVWQPSFVYVDQGAGATNIELLHKYGTDTFGQDRTNPGARLKDIVKAYDFGSKLEIHDPTTGEKIKKHAKPFLVENAVRFFEEFRINISASDVVMREQLQNYIIKNKSVTGLPLYGLMEPKIGDHRLDALMLALVGFKLELSSFGEPRYTTRVAIGPGFGISVNLENNIEKIQKKMNVLPEERFPDAPFSIRRMPGMVSGETQEVKTLRPGWDSDTEEKHILRSRLRKMKKQGRLYGTRPSRSKF